MKICECKKELTSGALNYKVGNKYRYENWLIDAYSQTFKMYKIYFNDDYTNFTKFDFEQYFIDENKIRKEKLKKINDESR